MVNICHKYHVPCKVIFENCYLTKEEIKKLAEIAKEIKPDFIKTSTGFGPSGAKVEDVKLMKSIVGDNVKVKAAGGIRNSDDFLAMIRAGADLDKIDFSQVSLYDELRKRNLPVTHVTRKLEVKQASSTISKTLKIKENDPVFYFHSYGYTKRIKK